MKKVLLFLCTAILLTGCGTSKKLSAPLSDIMNDMYKDVDLPETGNIELTKDNIKDYIGVDIDFKEALASDALMSAQAHSVVLIRLNDNQDVQKVKEQIKENAPSRKWICVEAESVIVENKDNVVILIMSYEEQAKQIQENFKKL